VWHGHGKHACSSIKQNTIASSNLLGNAFRDANNERDLVLDRIQASSRGEGWGHIDDGGVRLDRFLGFLYSIEHRKSQVGCATLLWCNACHYNRTRELCALGLLAHVSI
jgi:hypothetical protein